MEGLVKIKCGQEEAKSLLSRQTISLNKRNTHGPRQRRFTIRKDTRRSEMGVAVTREVPLSRSHHRHDCGAFKDTDSACTWRQGRGRVAENLKWPLKSYEPNRRETLGHIEGHKIFLHLISGLQVSAMTGKRVE